MLKEAIVSTESSTQETDLSVLNKKLDLELNLTECLAMRRIKAYRKALERQQELGVAIQDPFAFVPMSADSVQNNLDRFE
jgi:hypothetical protein